jgi:Zn-dependent protease with chaperone function
VAALLVQLWWREITTPDPAARAAALVRIRLGSVVLSVGATVVAAASFLFFEQREHPESTGMILPALGALTLAFWLAAALRTIRLAVATRRVLRRWMATAEPVVMPGIHVPSFAVTAAFPVVAVVGIFRPRLIVARSVLASCTSSQIVAIAAHERRHLRARDNLRRTLMSASPDLIAWLPLAARLRDAWSAAAEEAADDAAAEVGDEGRLELADALIRVARLGAGGSYAALPASALYRGENLDRRIRRLLEPVPAPARPRSAWHRRATIAAIAAVMALVLEGVHVIIELAVTFLP